MGITSELVLARSVRDVRAALVAVSGHTMGPYGEVALSGVPVRGTRIAIVDTVPTGIGDAQANAVRSLAPLLEDHGYTIVETDIAELDRLATCAGAIVRTVLSVSLANWLDTLDIADDEISPIAAAVAQEGRSLSATDLFSTDTDAARIAHGLWTLFAEVDAIVMPMLAGPPPKVGAMPTQRTDPDALWRQMAEIAPRAALANASGIPALSLPRGLDEAGLPLSAQLIGPIGADLLLLDIAQHIEAAAPWTFPADIAGADL